MWPSLFVTNVGRYVTLSLLIISLHVNCIHKEGLHRGKVLNKLSKQRLGVRWTLEKTGDTATVCTRWAKQTPPNKPRRRQVLVKGRQFLFLTLLLIVKFGKSLIGNRRKNKISFSLSRGYHNYIQKHSYEYGQNNPNEKRHLRMQWDVAAQKRKLTILKEKNVSFV